MVKIKAKIAFLDNELGRIVKPTDDSWEVSKERAKVLMDLGYVEKDKTFLIEELEKTEE